MTPYIKPGIMDIDEIISEVFEVPVDRIKSQDRKKTRSEVEARQFAMWWRESNTKDSPHEIGSMYGGRDRTTVLHAKKTVNNLMETNKVFREKAEDALIKLEPLKF